MGVITDGLVVEVLADTVAADMVEVAGIETVVVGVTYSIIGVT